MINFAQLPKGRGAQSDGADTNLAQAPVRQLTSQASTLIIYFSRSGNTEAHSKVDTKCKLGPLKRTPREFTERKFHPCRQRFKSVSFSGLAALKKSKGECPCTLTTVYE